MSLFTCILLGCLILGGIAGAAFAIIVKVFGLESFSMWTNDWFGKNENTDDFYKRF